MQNIDSKETDKFAAMAAQWWDPEGPCRPLHELNPIRLGFIKEFTSLHNEDVIDVGCGGGILTESLAKQANSAVGIDADKHVIQTAKLHALEHELTISYQVTTVETFASEHAESKDVVSCMEMLEHVPAPESVIASCAKIAKPGGLVFFSTLNRNLKSYLHSIVGAEYILQMLPKGTHDYDRFIKPHELNRVAEQAGLSLLDIRGVSYNPLLREFSLSNNTDINYICAYRKNGLPHD